MGGGIVNHCLGLDWNSSGGLQIVLSCSRTSPAKHTFVFGPANSTTIGQLAAMRAAADGTESAFKASMPSNVLDYYENDCDSNDRAGIKALFTAMKDRDAGLFINA